MISLVISWYSSISAILHISSSGTTGALHFRRILMENKRLAEFLADDRAMTLLKTIDGLNPLTLPENGLATRADVAKTLKWGLNETWELISQGVDAGVLRYHGGMLSKKRVDLTDLGEAVVDADGTEELRKIIRGEWECRE